MKTPILISHRGNIDGPIIARENSPDYIDEAIADGYDVEIDVRMAYVDGAWSLFLGHDTPDYPVTFEWLLKRRDKLWIHTKDFKSLDMLISLGLRVFYHQLEAHTIIGNAQVIWSHNLEEASSKSIIPMLSLDSIIYYGDKSTNEYVKNLMVYGVCSDYVAEIRFVINLRNKVTEFENLADKFNGNN